MDNFDPYNVLLAIATNIPVLLMTAFVLQGHMWSSTVYRKSQNTDGTRSLKSELAIKHETMKKMGF